MTIVGGVLLCFVAVLIVVAIHIIFFDNDDHNGFDDWFPKNGGGMTV